MALHNMRKLTSPMPLLLLHDGNISNRNQCRALAWGMDVRFNSVRELNVLQCHDDDLRADEHSVVIGCGRKTAPFTASLAIKSKSVQILHPRLWFTTSRFDCLVLPHHDRLSWFDDEKRIVRMHGALSWSLHRTALARYSHSNRTDAASILTVLVGGSMDRPQQVLDELEKARKSLDVRFVCSRRTPPALIERIAKRFNIWAPSVHHQHQRNPYRELLAVSDHFIVSADSISMISDVLSVLSERGLSSAGGSVHLLASSETTRDKHRKFIHDVNARLAGYLLPFESAAQVDCTAGGRLSHPPLLENETRRVGLAVRQVLFS